MKNFILFRWLRSLYDWVLAWSNHRHSLKALFAITFAEASFFPIPPDPLLMTMCAAKPSRAQMYSSITTFASVLGGCFGYLIGFLFWEATSDLFFQFVFSQEVFEKVILKFQENTFLSVFLASFTPIPFKVVTVAGGVGQIAILPFLGAAIIGRGLRFFIVGGLIYFFGKPVMTMIDRHFEKATLLFAVLLIGGLYIVKVIL